VSKKSKRVKKSFADQLREVFGLLQKKSDKSTREFESNTTAPAPPTQAQPPVVQITHIPGAQNMGSESSRPLPHSLSRNRIVWEKTPKPTTSKKKSQTQPGEKIEWGGALSSGFPDPASLIGIEDAFDHSPLLPGEKVVFCTQDKVAYHLVTWEFLRDQNQGRCCICGQSTWIERITLPGTLVARPVPETPLRPQVPVFPGEKIITLKEVPDFLYHAVIVEDYVHEVYRTRSTGTYFIRFERRAYGDPVFSGFKVVVFYNYVSSWTEIGLRIESYAGRRIRVRGVVQEHPKWGTEILVNSPRMIEVVG
jgi:hypothetical protein